MKTRFYCRPEDSEWGEVNIVVTSEGVEIEYSFMCTGKHYPPDDYELVYQTDGAYEIIIDPYSSCDFWPD